ncbi:hypothetical protein TNCT_482281 [Trichonephila clavata]|uniref:Uncharacterized protein n=1 Tax=Trichonephila clavata TaxID=2740835 RepID=A0A8X6H6L9_TRICU|nr:hypothetical protein TNCT_482281 [Trichonephila clavata]
MYSCSFRIVYDEETDLVGCLRDSVNKQDFGMALKETLTTMFTNHKAGVLIATSKSLGVMNYNDKYYFTDSHAWARTVQVPLIPTVKLVLLNVVPLMTLSEFAKALLVQVTYSIPSTT